MRTFQSLFLLAGFACLAGLPIGGVPTCCGYQAEPAATQSSTADSKELESRVDEYLMPYVSTGNFSSTVLIARNGEILFIKGYGNANRQEEIPNDEQTVFHLASISRIFTSAAIILLEQQGKLSLDDPLSKYLPDWPRGDEITIHHLLSLSAGFPNINTMPGYWAWSQKPQTPSSLCEKFRDLPIEFEPGEKTVHSNSNYNVLALLIEKTSGQSYGEFLANELFVPLGMSQTAHDDKAEPVPHEAIGYRPVGLADLQESQTLDWTVKTGNGSIYSSVTDLYKFDRMLANRSLLNDSSVDKLFTEHFPNHGYGWFVQQQPGGRELYINGRSPGFGAFWVRAAEPDITVIILGNLYNSVSTPIGRDLVKLVMGEDVRPETISPEEPDPKLLEQIAGAYQFGPDFYRPNAKRNFIVRQGHLFSGQDWLIPAGESTFVHRIYWSTLKFESDASGAFTRVLYDDFVGHRVND
ncbi:MAG: serine hydrolase domain-containing protein [Pirellulaceae bacterium]